MNALAIQTKRTGEPTMDNYSLQANEVSLYKGKAADGIEIMLTNLNLVVVKKTPRFFKKDEVETFVYSKDDIKMYNGVPQVKQKESLVEIFLTSEELKVEFPSRTEAHKFVSAAHELLTGKKTTVRGAEKIKSAIELVDNTLGINSVDAVKSVMEKGIVGSIFGGIGKKAKTQSKTAAAKETVDLGKEVIGTVAMISTSKTEAKTEDYNEKIETVKKLKELADAGILTQEEFEEKKKQLLDL